MKKLALSKVVLLGLLASANSNANELSGVVGIGYGFGGDELMEGFYLNGETDKIKANEGISIFGGIDYTMYQNYILRGTVGYKFDDISASNGEISFTRIPVELTLFKGIYNHKIGAGLTYHTSVTLECDVANLCNSDIDFEDSTGFTVQYEYAFPSISQGNFAIGLKYTSIDYKTNLSNMSFDGSGFDLHVSFLF